MTKDWSNEPVYIEPYKAGDFEKKGQTVDVSQDIASWPPVILQELASRAPYAFQSSSPEIEFEKIDDKTGSAFGAVILRKPYQTPGLGGPRERLEVEPEKVAVPIVIEAFKLKPFEVFITGDRVMPLTENRYAEAVGTSRISTGIDPYQQGSPMFMDKMVPPAVGYLGNMYGNYSLGGGSEGDYGAGPGKGAAGFLNLKLEKASAADSAKDRTFVNLLKGTISQIDYDRFSNAVGTDARMVAGFSLNKTMNIVREILGAKPSSGDDYLDFVERAAPVHLVHLTRLSNGLWRAVETNDYFYKPVIRELKASEVVDRYSSIDPGISRTIAGSNEALIESAERSHIRPIILEEHDAAAEEIESDGHYLVVTKSGAVVEGQVFSKMIDYAGNPFPAKLFTAGSAYALQEEICGQRLGEAWPNLKGGSVESGVEATFYGPDGDSTVALLPFHTTSVGWASGYMAIQARGLSDENLTFILMPGVTRFVNATGISGPHIGGFLGGNIYYIPPSWNFMPLGRKLPLVGDPKEVKTLLGRRVFFSNDNPFEIETSKRGNSRSLRVIPGSGGTFTLKGDILETIKRDTELQDLPSTKAHWILSLFGVPFDDCAKITAMAVSRGESNVTNLRPAKDIVKKEQIFDRNVADLALVLRRNLMKEASTIGNPEAVDAMLALNFVTEQNLIAFLENIPMFRDVEEKLAELYLYSTLGLKDQVPEAAALGAMKSLNEVNEQLEYLQSMLQMPPAQIQPEAVA